MYTILRFSLLVQGEAESFFLLVFSVESMAEEETSRLRERLLRFERESRYLRKDSDDRKVMEEVFDQATMLALKELLAKGEISELNGVVSAGKEARVYYGAIKDGEPRAVKIYMTVSSEFRKRLIYIAGDRRFGRIPAGSREIIKLWVQKEFKNLQLADSARVRVPKPYSFFRNVLVMEYIGSPPMPAPILAEVEVDDSDYRRVFKSISKLYRSAQLVHADLSEYNIFKWGKEIVIFDMGTAVTTSHPQARNFLLRDITNMVRFFRKRGITGKEPEEWLEEISK